MKALIVSRLVVLSACVLGAASLGMAGCSSTPNTTNGESASDLASGQANVFTQHNDNARTGGNLQETTLTPANVNTRTFGKKFILPVDGQIYAQTLYTSAGVGLPRNVVYVATQNNSVYAFDADSGARIWKQSGLGTAVAANQVPSATQSCGDIGVQIGITSTPVIDPGSKTMFVVAKTAAAGGGMAQTLFKIDILTGDIVSQQVIEATSAGVTFDPQIQLNRAGLLLSKGKVYVAFAGHCDRAAYHGWVMSYDADDLTQKAVFLDTPTGTTGGIWQAGSGLVADQDGSVYLMTGNGTFDRTVNTTDDVTPNSTVMPANVGSSYLKLTEDLTLADFFTPSNADLLNPYDIDVGSSGPILLPGSNRIVGGTKEGVLYLLDTNKMGRFTPTDITREGAVQRINDAYHNKLNNNFGALYALRDVGDRKYDAYRGIMGAGLQAAPNVHGSPAFFTGPTGSFIYVWTEVAHLKAFRFNGSTFDPNPILNNNDDYLNTPIAGGMPGGFLSVTANGTQNGILWATHPLNADANAPSSRVIGILRAYDANNISRELWNSQMDFPNQTVPTFAKFVPPTIANGKVFVPTFSNEVVVYGLK